MRRDLLITTNAVLLAAIVVHATDHAFQDRGLGALNTEVIAGGTVVALLATGSLLLAIRRHPKAPLASALVGFYIFTVVTASHFAPHWSAFSDPYSGLGLGAFSWAAAVFEVLMALVVGIAGVMALRRPAARTVATG